jgi:serine/threonine protein phosphatase 1
MLVTLRGGGRIWAVSAIHGNAERLRALHQALASHVKTGDQLVYLGGYLGYGPDVLAAIDEILLFRRAFIAQPGAQPEDVALLRGGHEEMWQKLLQLQFAADPVQVLRWMLDHGLGATLEAYGSTADEAMAVAEDGAVAMTRWTNGLRGAMRAHDGHTALMSALRHAAVTDDGAMLFVHAGLDPSLALADQGDRFWWGSPAFDAMTEPYGGFSRIVRAHAPNAVAGAIAAASPTVTTMGGVPGDPLVAACFAADGDVLQVVRA